MKVLLPLAAVLLAGCSGDGHALDPYVMDILEAPDACFYIDLADEPWDQVAGATGLKSNPGSVHNHILALDGVAPVENRVALIECRLEGEASQYLSGAERFASAEDARTWAAAAQREGSQFTLGARCVPQALVFLDGPVIGGIGTFTSQWDPTFQAAADQAFDRILADTGASDYCRDSQRAN